MKRVAAWYWAISGVFGGGGRRVSEGEGQVVVFLRTLLKDLSFCIAASSEGMGFKVVGDVHCKYLRSVYDQIAVIHRVSIPKYCHW